MVSFELDGRLVFTEILSLQARNVARFLNEPSKPCGFRASSRLTLDHGIYRGRGWHGKFNAPAHGTAKLNVGERSESSL